MTNGIKNELVGKRFGRLFVIGEGPVRKNRNVCWVCKCDCGKTKIIAGHSLKSGATKSCGCLKKETLKTVNIGRKSKRLVDLTGEKFGRWTVIKRAQNGKNGRTMWLCECECGTFRSVQASSLKAKKNMSKSCGCYERDNPSGLSHGGSKTRIYRIWIQIKTRCGNPNWHSYHRYGGRGIKICDKWNNSFESFQKWALKFGYKEHLTIDRINNDASYCPENCQWITAAENIGKRWA